VCVGKPVYVHEASVCEPLDASFQLISDVLCVGGKLLGVVWVRIIVQFGNHHAIRHTNTAYLGHQNYVGEGEDCELGGDCELGVDEEWDVGFVLVVPFRFPPLFRQLIHVINFPLYETID